MNAKNNVHLVEKNVHGAWVVYGAIGVKQYYGYSKAEAVRRYKEECKNTIITEVKK